jgi:hypothetical protein
MNQTPITSHLVPHDRRAAHVAQLFGARWLWIEGFCFDTAASLCAQYDGGLWDYIALSNSGYYMRPTSGVLLRLACANGFEGSVSADAFGAICCLYAFSHLSFSPDEEFAALCTNHYHWLRAYVLQHPEATSILAAID